MIGNCYRCGHAAVYHGRAHPICDVRRCQCIGYDPVPRQADTTATVFDPADGEWLRRSIEALPGECHDGEGLGCETHPCTENVSRAAVLALLAP